VKLPKRVRSKAKRLKSEAMKPINPLTIGSVSALASTPAAEVRSLTLDLCDTMPPDAFKALVKNLANALPPTVHRALVARYSKSFAGGFGVSTVNALLSRRLAKKAVALWLDKVRSEDLQNIVRNAVKVLPEQTIENWTPYAQAFVDRAENNTRASLTTDGIGKNAAVRWPILPATTEKLKTEKAGSLRGRLKKMTSEEARWLLVTARPLLLETLEEEEDDLEVVFRAVTAVSRRCAPANLMGYLPFWAKQRLLLSEASEAYDWFNGTEDTVEMGGHSAFSALAMLRAGSVVVPESVVDTALVLSGCITPKALRELPRSPQEQLSIISAVTSSALSSATDTAGTALNFEMLDKDNDNLLSKKEFLKGSMDSGISSTKGAVLFDLLDLDGNGNLDASEFSLGAQILRDFETENGASNQTTKDVINVGTGEMLTQFRSMTNLTNIEGSGVSPLGNALVQALDDLPPSFVADQVAELIEGVPAEVLLKELSTLVGSLPSDIIINVASDLIDTVPASALRAIAVEVVAIQNDGPGGPRPYPALAREVVRHCEDDTLRRTARELVQQLPPLAFRNRLMQAIKRAGSTSLKSRLLKAVRLFGDRTRPYLSFKDFREDTSSQSAIPTKLSEESEEDEGNAKQPTGVLGVARTAANRINGRRRARILRNVVQQLPPDLLLAKVLETLARLPPESFSGLTSNLSTLVWDLLVKRAGPRNAAAVATGVTSGAGVATGAALGAANKGLLFGLSKGLFLSKGAVLGTSALTATAAAIGTSQGQAATKALAETLTSSTSDVLDTLTSSSSDALDNLASSLPKYDATGEMVISNLAQLFPLQLAVEASGAAALIGLAVYFLSSKSAWGPLSALANLNQGSWLGERSGNEVSRRLLIEITRTSPACARVLSHHIENSPEWQQRGFVSKAWNLQNSSEVDRSISLNSAIGPGDDDAFSSRS